MALIGCVECGAQVSDKASACPKCGHPIAPAQPAARRPEYSLSPTSSEASSSGGWLKWVLIVPAVLFGLVMCIGTVSDPDGTRAAARLEAQKKECSAALMSSIGHSTVGYADKAAYDAKVREKVMAKEVAQDVFLKLSQKAASIPTGLAFSAWLHRTTRSIALDAVRSENRCLRRESVAAGRHKSNRQNDSKLAHATKIPN